MSDVRATDVLANERTFLAYVRTSLSFVAFGFVVARFGLFVEEITQFTHTASSSPHYSTAFGVTMAIAGVVIGVMGGWRYAVADKALQRGEVKALPRSIGYIVTIVVAAIGVFVAVFLATYY